MGAGTVISVEEYLRTSYSPDREYVDGVLVERNLGKKPHSRVQRNLIVALAGKHPELYVWPELRMRTSGEHHRIPDVCVTLSEPESNVLEEPPFIAIEILSEDDSVTDLVEKLKEYRAIGVPNIWVFDPRQREMLTYEGNVLQVMEGNIIATAAEPRIELTRDEIFRD